MKYSRQLAALALSFGLGTVSAQAQATGMANAPAMALAQTQTSGSANIPPIRSPYAQTTRTTDASEIGFPHAPITGAGHSQTPEDSVKTAVNLLFKGMLSSDADMIRRSFADSAILQTIANRQGKQRIETEKLGDFAAAVAKLTPGDADERIQFGIIRIDGPLAIVWAPYEFYYKGKYSHQGVDSFQLIRVDGIWKIQYLIDTRRK